MKKEKKLKRQIKALGRKFSNPFPYCVKIHTGGEFIQR